MAMATKIFHYRVCMASSLLRKISLESRVLCCSNMSMFIFLMAAVSGKIDVNMSESTCWKGIGYQPSIWLWADIEKYCRMDFCNPAMRFLWCRYILSKCVQHIGPIFIHEQILISIQLLDLFDRSRGIAWFWGQSEFLGEYENTCKLQHIWRISEWHSSPIKPGIYTRVSSQAKWWLVYWLEFEYRLTHAHLENCSRFDSTNHSKFRFSVCFECKKFLLILSYFPCLLSIVPARRCIWSK